MDDAEVEKRRVAINTDSSLVMIDTSDSDVAKALRARQKKLGDVTLTDIYSNRYTWKRDYHRADGTYYSSHFCKIGEHNQVDRTNSPNLSKKHKDAVDVAAVLVLQNRLKVVTRCCYPNHAALATTLPSWVPGPHRMSCVDTFDFHVNGKLSVKDEFAWKGFLIDLAVLCDGELHTAIEIQKTHANSKKKRDAFNEHGVRNVQIDAEELTGKCRDIDLCTLNADDVVVDNHPIDAANTWICEVCVPKQRTERNRVAALERLRETKKRKRDEKEAPLLTNYLAPEDGKFLKGYLYACTPSATAKCHVFFLNETTRVGEINPNPRRFKILAPTKSFVDAYLTSLDGAAISLKLENVAMDQPKAGFIAMHYMFIRDDRLIYEGHELPGVHV
jgi:hypothetical protein